MQKKIMSRFFRLIIFKIQRCFRLRVRKFRGILWDNIKVKNKKNADVFSVFLFYFSASSPILHTNRERVEPLCGQNRSLFLFKSNTRLKFLNACFYSCL